MATRNSGSAEVLATLVNGSYATCRVIEGRIRHGAPATVIRNGQKLGRREITTLNVAKAAVAFAEAGQDCVMMMSGTTFVAGDIIKTGR